MTVAAAAAVAVGSMAKPTVAVVLEAEEECAGQRHRISASVRPSCTPRGRRNPVGWEHASARSPCSAPRGAFPAPG